MFALKRRLYQLILRLHPAAFRNRFAREMSLDFEDALATYGFSRLLADATRSLLRQWTAPAFSAQRERAPIPSHPLLAGHYMPLTDAPLTPFELLRGSLLFAVLLFLFSLAFSARTNRIAGGNFQGLPANQNTAMATAAAGAFQTPYNPNYPRSRTSSSGSSSASGTSFIPAGILVPGTLGPLVVGSGKPAPPPRVSLIQILLPCIFISLIIWIASLLVRLTQSAALRVGIVSLSLLAIVAAAAFVPVQSPPAHAQSHLDSQTQPVAFEVATIRPSPPQPAPQPSPLSGPQRPVLAFTGMPNHQTGDRIHVDGPVRLFIAAAYGLPIGSESRVVGGPAWVSSDGYDIDAKIDDSLYAEMQNTPPAARQHYIQIMEEGLLATRFHLKAHWETQTLPVYALQVATINAKLVPAKSDEQTFMPVLFNGSDRSLSATGISMDQLVHSPLWRPVTDRIVVDQTGLTAKYDFKLKWSSDSLTASSAGTPSSEPTLFTALQQQLGLKLVPTKAPVEVLVIDHIEKPSEN